MLKDEQKDLFLQLAVVAAKANGKFDETEQEMLIKFANEMNIDLFGSFKVARAVAKKAMIPAKYGRIINIASMYGLVGNKVAPCSPYHAAKGGVVNMTRGLASEWGKYNINVNAICPGYFYSPLTKFPL